MAGELIKFSVHSEPDMRGFAFGVGRFANKVGDWKPLLQAFDQLFRGAMQKQFATQGSASGGWAPLSAAYAAWKETHFPGRPIGVLRGFLRSGMTGGSGYTAHISSTEADFGLGGGPAMEYGKYFDGGGRGPARKVVAFDAGEPKRWQKLTHAWLYDLAVESGWL